MCLILNGLCAEDLHDSKITNKECQIVSVLSVMIIGKNGGCRMSRAVSAFNPGVLCNRSFQGRLDAYFFAVMKALEVVVALENALLGLVSKSVALVELLPERMASAASCRLMECQKSNPSVKLFPTCMRCQSGGGFKGRP